ncbi:hypothetical protein [Thiolapillus sp.]
MSKKHDEAEARRQDVAGEGRRKPYVAPQIIMRETLESVAVGGCAKADLGTCGFGGIGGPINS